MKWFLCLSLLFCRVDHCQANFEKRIALVIGNSNYKHGASLNNPKNDAEDMKKFLESHGFDVIDGKSLNREKTLLKVKNFITELQHSDVGFFYYSGHGIQIDGLNYLLPTDQKIQSEYETKQNAILINDILLEMEKAHNGLNLIMLDACRDNPFVIGRRSSGKGLVRIDAGKRAGSLIMYATAENETADDGEGRNGLYTGAFLEVAKSNPRLDISNILIDTRNKVMKISGNSQIPWESGSLTEQFYFSPPSNLPAAINNFDYRNVVSEEVIVLGNKYQKNFPKRARKSFKCKNLGNCQFEFYGKPTEDLRSYVENKMRESFGIYKDQIAVSCSFKRKSISCSAKGVQAKSRFNSAVFKQKLFGS